MMANQAENAVADDWIAKAPTAYDAMQRAINHATELLSLSDFAEATRILRLAKQTVQNMESDDE